MQKLTTSKHITNRTYRKCNMVNTIKLCVLMLRIIAIEAFNKEQLYKATSAELSQLILKLQGYNPFVKKKCNDITVSNY